MDLTTASNMQLQAQYEELNKTLGEHTMAMASAEGWLDETLRRIAAGREDEDRHELGNKAQDLLNELKIHKKSATIIILKLYKIQYEFDRRTGTNTSEHN